MHRRSHVFIHKCSITIPIDRRYWDQATENLFQAIDTEPKLLIWRFDQESDRYCIYRHGWKLIIESSPRANEKCFIQAFPIKGPAAFMRLEWNPAEAGYNATREIVGVLTRYVPGFEAAWPNAMITRIDATFDVTGLSIGEVYVFTKSANTRQKPFRENEGRLNGIYLGVPKSERRLALYDKRFEQLGEERRFGPPRGAGRPPYWIPPRTRFEFRFSRIGLVREIPTFANGLIRYFVALRSKARAYKGGDSWDSFVGRCDRWGAQSALGSLLDRKRRAMYRKTLDTHCTPAWFCRRTLWQEALQAMSEALCIQGASSY